jgi:hypothetical protein
LIIELNQYVFLLDPEIYDLHQVLVQNKMEVLSRILTLPHSYRIQLQNLLDYLINIDKEHYKINHRQSFIFTNPNESEDSYTISKEGKDSNFDETSTNCEHISMENIAIRNYLSSKSSRELRKTANSQQDYLLSFIQDYLDELLKHSRRPSEILQPKPFHIVVNGLAGSGKSFVIGIIEKMLNEYCVAESAKVSRARKNSGLLKVAHTGKAALNINSYTIHSGLEMVNIEFYYFLTKLR